MITAIMRALAAAASAKDASALEASISALKSSVSALDKSISDLDSKSGGWEGLAIASSIAVGIAIVFELVFMFLDHRDEVDDWARGIIHPPDRPANTRFWLNFVATGVVAIGVLGEAWASLELSSINNQLRSKTSQLRADSDQLLALVTQEAGSAATSAQKAKDAEAELEKEAAALEKRFTVLSMDVDAQEPRAVLLRRSSKSFLGKMSLFAGQRFIAEQCGIPAMNRAGIEQAGVETTLYHLLLQANWEPFKPMMNWRNCNEWAGMHVFVSESAPPKTRKAADELAKQVQEIFPPQELPIETISSGPLDDDAESPLAVTARNPEVITVVAAIRPEQGSRHVAVAAKRH